MKPRAKQERLSPSQGFTEPKKRDLNPSLAIFLRNSFNWFEAFATRHDHPFKLLCGSSLFFGSRVRIPKVATPQDPTSSTFLLEPSMPAPTLLSAPPLCHIPHVHCLRRIHRVADSYPGGGRWGRVSPNKCHTNGPDLA